MDFTEPANWDQIRREAEEFVAEHVTRAVVEHERRTGDGVDRALTRKLGERGWIAAGWPVAEGGAGLGPVGGPAVWDAISHGRDSTLCPGTPKLPAPALPASGSPEPRARSLPCATGRG